MSTIKPPPIFFYSCRGWGNTSYDKGGNIKEVISKGEAFLWLRGCFSKRDSTIVKQSPFAEVHSLYHVWLRSLD